MKKFVVFSNSTEIPVYQLSVSNKYIAKGFIIDILNNWSKMLPINCSFESNDEKEHDVHKIIFNAPKDYGLEIKENLCNVYFKIVKYEPSYEIREIFD